ncbi:MAG: hypothetical protein AAGJ53_08965, partial [Pseudomonadota bacterium]
IYASAIGMLLTIGIAGLMFGTPSSSTSGLTIFSPNATSNRATGFYVEIPLVLSGSGTKLAKAERRLLKFCGLDGEARRIDAGLRRLAADGYSARPGLQLDLVEAGRYLSCTLENIGKRLCNKPARKRLATALKSYFKARQTFRTTRHAVWAAVIPMIHADYPKVTRYERGAARGTLDEQHYKTAHPGVAEGLAAVTQHGLFGRRDFGWFAADIPRELMPYMKRKVYDPPC